MSEQTTLDPFAVWKEMYEKTESKWNEVLHETMQQEAFSEWMGQVQNAYLQYQEVVQNNTESYLKQVNIPTREDIANVATLVINLEEKVEKLDQQLENLEQKLEDDLITNPSQTEMNRLKSSIARLDKKLETILKVIQQPQQTEVSSINKNNTVASTPPTPPTAPPEEKK